MGKPLVDAGKRVSPNLDLDGDTVGAKENVAFEVAGAGARDTDGIGPKGFECCKG